MSKSTNGLRKVGLASLAVTLTLGAGLAGAGAANAVVDFTFDRIAGSDRFDTAKQVASNFDGLQSFDEVILVNGQRGFYADALAAAYLAGDKQIPILLTKVDETPQFTLDALEAAGVTKITIVGGEGVVSAEQEAALAEDYTVTRIEGIDRYKTNAEVLKAAGTTTVDTGFVAAGNNFADALAGSPLAYKGSPLGLAKLGDIDDDVKNALVASGIKKVVILGGPTIVGPAVEAELKAAGLTVERIAGADRTETSMDLADYAIKNLGVSDKGANVASGSSTLYGADALSGGPLTGEQNRPMLITMNIDNPGQLESWFKAHANTLTDGAIFGGNGAVSTRVEELLAKAASSVTSNQDLAVSPQDSATLTALTGSSEGTGDDRQYTVSGLTAGTTYTVALLPADNVRVGADGQVTFADSTGTNGQADDLGDDATSAAHISVVNGTANADDMVTAAPVNGQISFTVDGDADGDVVPVVFKDANANTALDVAATGDWGAPTDAELFGIGGEINYNPSEGTAGTQAPAAITEVDKAANNFVAGSFYEYDANDTYYIGSVGIENQVTMDEFEAELSVGDWTGAGTSYSPNPAFSSVFVLDDRTPAAPTSLDEVTANTTETSTTITVGGVASDASAVTVYGLVDGDADGTDHEDGAGAGVDNDVVTTDSKVYATAAADQDATLAGFQVNVTGLTSDTTYDFAATQTVGSEESELSPELEVTTAGPDTTAPTMNNTATANDINNGVGSTNQVIVTFNEPVASVNASLITVSPAAQPGLEIAVTGATARNSTGTSWTLTLGQALDDAGSDVTYNINTKDGAYTDSAGNKSVAATPDATFAY